LKSIRIIISIALVGVASLMMNQDLKKNHYSAHRIGLGDFSASTLEAWQRERDWETWLERHLEQHAMAYSRDGKQFVVQAKQETKTELESLLQSWNQLESQRAQIAQSETQVQARTLASEIAEMQLQTEALDRLILNLATYQTQVPVAPELKTEEKSPTPNLNTSKLKDLPQLMSESKTTHSDAAKLQSDLGEMEQVVQNKLSHLESDLKNLQSTSSNNDLAILNELRDARLEDSKRSNQSLQLLYKELHRLESELKTDLNQVLTFMSDVDNHQTTRWHHEKNMLMERLALQRSSLTRKISNLKATPAIKITAPLYAKVESSAIPLTQAQLSESFRFLLAGFLSCLLFNLIWEVIAQRKSL